MKTLAASIASIALILASAASAKTIAVDGGRIDGITLPSGVAAWLGVPFAAPPLRNLRWKPPQPVVPWHGTYHADRYAPECLQPLRGSMQNNYFGNEATSEDCLYLNIWAPTTARKAPVIVWIFGGAFNIGSASMANYSGEPLARDGAVRVNIAYRVGPLGFLSLPELSRESGYGGSGNYGLMDQIAALQWVRRNIASFGGDPDNVTIVGQSAGSMSVSVLQMSPLAKGLFARAVGMSGSAFGGMVPLTLNKAETQGEALEKELGITSLKDLRALAGDKLVAASSPRLAIVLDHHVVTGTAEEVFSTHQQNDVPVLIGYTRDDSLRALAPVQTAQELKNMVRGRFPAQADRILAAYGTADPARAAADIARDSSVGLQTADWARYQQNFGTKAAYVYLFTRRHPYAAGIRFSDHDPAMAGAYHGGDIPYWLGTQDAFNLHRQTRNWEPGDRSLSLAMSQALLTFARNGKPVSPGLGAWPAFKAAAPQLMRLGLDSQAAAWPHFADMALFSEVITPQPTRGAPQPAQLRSP